MGFVRALREQLRLNEATNPTLPKLSKKLTDTEMLLLIETAFDLLSHLLRAGFRVIFEGYFSFYTKAIKRQCKNLHTNDVWMTYMRRLRWKPAPDFKKATEVEITEAEYLKEVKDKKEEAPVG